MSRPTPEITAPQTTCELAFILGRSSRWVADKCRSGEIETCPVGKPYLIPVNECNRILKNERNTANTHRNAASER